MRRTHTLVRLPYTPLGDHLPPLNTVSTRGPRDIRICATTSQPLPPWQLLPSFFLSELRGVRYYLLLAYEPWVRRASFHPTQLANINSVECSCSDTVIIFHVHLHVFLSMLIRFHLFDPINTQCSLCKTFPCSCATRIFQQPVDRYRYFDNVKLLIRRRNLLHTFTFVFTINQ